MNHCRECGKETPEKVTKNPHWIVFNDNEGKENYICVTCFHGEHLISYDYATSSVD